MQIWILGQFLYASGMVSNPYFRNVQSHYHLVKILATLAVLPAEPVYSIEPLTAKGSLIGHTMNILTDTALQAYLTDTRLPDFLELFPHLENTMIYLLHTRQAVPFSGHCSLRLEISGGYSATVAMALTANPQMKFLLGVPRLERHLADFMLADHASTYSLSILTPPFAVRPTACPP
ncbi:hypothetical protein BDK51DRAFT_53201 [Blyttiomyces helicus]|uniref:Uncharacterized protein n=1 Tax=Blyttiomyces helicus TaxID=388810 RepID=A0A4P9WGP3_9FUNG|nr:hypothetical protein BDK51DRAFT_53201 [Blyttiomyces helicus]|eukprot:RKO91874.1 hypothetical protein BDK51DRAFT_53201 [Blyttiomyces helicus]